MARILGGLVGVAIAGALVAISAAILVAASLGPVVAAIIAFLGLSTGAWIAVAIFTVVIFTVFAYVIAALATLPAIAAATVAALPPIPLEAFMSGVITGMAAGVNFGVWTLLFPGIGTAIGGIVGLICLLSVIPALSRNAVFQGILGWASWAFPMSWIVTPLGLLLFIVNLGPAIAALGPGAVRFDVTTGSIETTGGLVGITGFVGGFSLGNFNFLAPGAGQGLGIQTPFTAPGLSAHETGHTLTVGGLGGVFHWIGAVDENVPPLGRMEAAYAELVADGHLPRAFPPNLHVRIWS